MTNPAADAIRKLRDDNAIMMDRLAERVKEAKDTYDVVKTQYDRMVEADAGFVRAIDILEGRTADLVEIDDLAPEGHVQEHEAFDQSAAVVEPEPEPTPFNLHFKKTRTR